MDKNIEIVEENRTAMKAITKRCDLCKTPVIWSIENEWWDCPKCGNVMF